MWHTIFITVHAVTAGIAMLAGCVAIGHRALFGTYLWSLVAMEVFLVLAVIEEWTVIDVAAQVVFVGFAVLGLFMLWRADQARRIRPTESRGPSASYIAHMGFTLVALFDAFIVILVLNLGAPVWLVAAVGVLLAVVGHFMIHLVRDKLVGSPGDQRQVSLSG